MVMSISVQKDEKHSMKPKDLERHACTVLAAAARTRASATVPRRGKVRKCAVNALILLGVNLKSLKLSECVGGGARERLLAMVREEEENGTCGLTEGAL